MYADTTSTTGHCGKITTSQLHNKYFLMNSRYERAGTVGFRCAADVKGSDAPLDCGGNAVCSTFEAPAANVKLPVEAAAAGEWIVWAGDQVVRSPASATRIGAAKSSTGNPLFGCNGTQSTFAWLKGSTNKGICVTDGSKGIAFTVDAYKKRNKNNKNKNNNNDTASTLTVYAGAVASAAIITATLVDGSDTTVITEKVNTTETDILASFTSNLMWQLRFTAKDPAATLTVNITSDATVPPPPPSPPAPTPAPCGSAICGAVAVHKGLVDLSAVGTSDWTHYGLTDSLSAVNRKCNISTSLIHPLTVQRGGGGLY